MLPLIVGVCGSWMLMMMMIWWVPHTLLVVCIPTARWWWWSWWSYVNCYMFCLWLNDVMFTMLILCCESKWHSVPMSKLLASVSGSKLSEVIYLSLIHIWKSIRLYCSTLSQGKSIVVTYIIWYKYFQGSLNGYVI